MVTDCLFIESEFILKKLNKKLSLVGAASAGLLLLSGCVQTHIVDGVRVPTEAATQGLTYQILVRPMSAFVDLFANNMNLGYGWGIVLVTLIIRFLILPLGLNQAYKSTYMQEKTAYLAPVFEPLNARLKAATTPDERMAAQQALMKAQKDNGINMLASMGCLPLLIQWPFFIALYNAAAYTPGISTATFFGINLGHPNSIVITLIAGIFYFLQTWISTKSMTPEQKKTGLTMLIMSPVMIIIFSFISPAGVGLYWAVGGIVMVIQQVIITYVMKPRMRKKIEEEFRNNPPKMADLPRDVTPKSTTDQGTKNLDTPRKSTNKSGRNSGKQKRK